MYKVFTHDIDLRAFNTKEGDTSHVLVQSVLGGTLYTSAECPRGTLLGWGGGGILHY